MITIDIDDREVLSELSALRDRMANMLPAMRVVAQVMRSDVLDRFERQNTPDGTPWKPLSLAAILLRARRHAPSGLKRRRAQTLARFAAGAKALVDTGVLRNSIQVVQVGHDSATVGTRIEYAALHQFGGRIGRGHSVTVPARPYMGLSREGKRELLEVIRQHIAGGLR